MAQLRLIVLRVLAGLVVFALVGGSMHFLNPDVSVPPIVWAVSAGAFAMAFALWGQPLRFVPWRSAGRLGTWLSYPLSIACVVVATYALWLMLAAQAPIGTP